MTQEEMLQYAKDNYSIGDKISRREFSNNRNTVIIESGCQDHHYWQNDIYLGRNQIYCGKNKVWAVNLSRSNNDNTPQYEIY